jgi:DegV family protein with EDD domain
MTVKIVTDSLSDIEADLAAKLDVTVVPLTVIFGHEQYLDRVTISAEQFYDRLINGNVWPTTTQPTPAAFAKVYEELSKEADEILVVTLSSRLSGTYESALGARSMAKTEARIEIIDSRTVAGGLGLIVSSASRVAREGANLDQLVKHVRRAMERVHFMAYFDTLTYLAKGGRIGKAKELLGSVLSIKQILTVKDGEMAPLTRKRSLSAGLDYLYSVMSSYPDAEEMAVEHTTAKDVADEFTARLSSFYPEEKIFRSSVSPVLGTYGGPGAMAVTVLAADK